MGVGVYRSDYNGTGVSFLVDGPLGDDSDQSDDFTATLKAAIAAVGERVGLGVPVPNDRFSADTDLRLLADGRFEIGFGGWEHDFVIGIAPNEHLRELLEDVQDFNEDETRRRSGADGLWHRLYQWHNAAELLVDEYGLPAPEVDRLVAETVDNLRQLLIWEIQGYGGECRFATSNYTSGRYSSLSEENPDARRAEIERLTAEVKAAMARLDAPAIENLKSLSPEQRNELLKMTDRSRLSEYKSDLQKLHVLVPYAVKAKANGRLVHQINLYDLTDDAMVRSSMVPESLKGAMEALFRDGEEEEYQPLPDTPEWAEWWDLNRAKESRSNFLQIIASAQDIAAVWKDDIILRFEDLDGEFYEVDLLGSSSVVYELPILGFNPEAPFEDQMHLMLWVRVDDTPQAKAVFEAACEQIGGALLPPEEMKKLPPRANFSDADVTFSGGQYAKAIQQLGACVKSTYAAFDSGLSPDDLKQRYDALNQGEHPAFTQDAWRVTDGTDYWAWVRSELDNSVAPRHQPDTPPSLGL